MSDGGDTLRLTTWRHRANRVEIEHTRELDPGDEARLHAAVRAYVETLARFVQPTPPILQEPDHG